MKFTAVGDFLIQEIFSIDYDGFKDIREYILQGDARFFNLETTINEVKSCFASQFSGGSYLRAVPGVIDNAKEFGFNMINCNNNHSMDFSYDGLLSTVEFVKKSGLCSTGIGRNLEEASAPAYLETKNGKVAFVSVSTSFDPSAIAGNLSENFFGRPGVNGLRHKDIIQLTKEQMARMKEIADAVGINLERDLDRRDGYLTELPENFFEFNTMLCETSDNSGIRSEMDKRDLERTINSIKVAKKNADYVFVSLHDHTFYKAIENVPPYLEDFCHICVDNGADAVIGHGPHLIRGIEIYKNRPIFYSLGDFVLQLNSIPCAPAEFYEKYDVTVDAGMEELLRVRSNNGQRGLMYIREMFETFIPYFEIKDGKLTHLELMPVELQFDETDIKVRGIPKPAKDFSFIERLQRLSNRYGTKMKIKDGKVIVEV